MQVFREFVIRDGDRFRACMHFIREVAHQLGPQGRLIRVAVMEDQAMAGDWHRRKLHGVLSRIAENAWVPDVETGEMRQFDLDTWKDFLARKFLGTRDVTYPDGTVEQRRRSTERLTAEESEQFILQIEVYGAELGLDMTYERKAADLRGRGGSVRGRA